MTNKQHQRKTIENCRCRSVFSGFTRHAFTMMEIMVTMSIIAVVSSIVLPGASNFYSSERTKAVAEIMVQNIRMVKYRAMQEQALHRMIFSPTGETYKIQIHSGFIEDSGVAKPDLVAGLSEENYDNIKWESVLDVEEIEIDPGVTVTRSAYLAGRTIYFWPDGYLVTAVSGSISETNKNLLPECYILFEYGSSRVRVYLNAMGVLSSESYAVDNDGDSDADVLW